LPLGYAPENLPTSPPNSSSPPRCGNQLPDFPVVGSTDPDWRKFLRDHLDPDQIKGARLAA